eukprot:m.111832 g.111832  ORF g.111832 m.111832 type:complete len:492 (-) comp15397_c0_seq2:93-1568(-)
MGLVLIFLAQPLSKNLLFYYSAGTVLGTLLLLTVAFIIVGKEVNRRVSTLMAIFLGTTSSLLAATGISMAELPSSVDVVNLLVQVALFQHENVYFSYGLYAVLLICFLVTYWFGPPSPRTQDTISLVFYMLGGGLLILCMQERYLATILAALTMMLASFLHSASGQNAVQMLSPGNSTPMSNSREFSMVSPPHAGALFSETRAPQPSDRRQRRLDRLRDEIADSPARIRNTVTRRFGNPDLLYAFVDGEEDLDDEEYQQVTHALAAAQAEVEAAKYITTAAAAARDEAGLFSGDEVAEPQPIKFTNSPRKKVTKRVVKHVVHNSGPGPETQPSPQPQSFLASFLSPQRAVEPLVEPGSGPEPAPERVQPTHRRIMSSRVTRTPPVVPSAPLPDTMDMRYEVTEPEMVDEPEEHIVRRRVEVKRRVLKKTTTPSRVASNPAYPQAAGKWTQTEVDAMSNSDLRRVALAKGYTGAVTSTTRPYVARKVVGTSK